MAFLGRILTQLLTQLVEWLYLKVQGWAKRIANWKRIDKAAEDSVSDLKNAKTPEEVDRATDKALDGF